MPAPCSLWTSPIVPTRCPDGLAMKKRPAAISREPAEPDQPTKWTGRTHSLTAVRVPVPPSLRPERRPASPVMEVGLHSTKILRLIPEAWISID